MINYAEIFFDVNIWSYNFYPSAPRPARCEISIITASLAITHNDFHTNRSIGTSDEMNSTGKKEKEKRNLKAKENKEKEIYGGTSKLARTSYATRRSLPFIFLSSRSRVFLVYIARSRKVLSASHRVRTARNTLLACSPTRLPIRNRVRF